LESFRAEQPSARASQQQASRLDELDGQAIQVEVFFLAFLEFGP
jgi:hypothetical protein